MATKVTRLSKLQVQALAEEYPPELLDLGVTTATFVGEAAEALAVLEERMADLPANGHPKASLLAVVRKLKAAAAVDEPEVETVQETLEVEAPEVEPEPEPEVVTVKAKAPRAAKAETAKKNPAIAKLVDGIETGAFKDLLEAEGLTPGGLARQLEVEPAVVAKIVGGKRTPRPTAPANSIAGRLAAWYVAAAKRAAKKAS